MDYLPLSTSGAPHLVVPWVAKHVYDGKEFSSFPQRCGFTDNYTTYPTDQLASLIQSWLYFGVIRLFFTPFGQAIDPELFREDFTRNTAAPHVENEQLDSRILVRLLDQWLKKVVAPAVVPWKAKTPPKPSCGDLFEFRDSFIKFLEEALAIIHTFDKLPQSTTWPMPIIILSTKILVISLSGVLRELLTYEYGGDNSLSMLYSYTPGVIENAFPLGNLDDWQISSSCQLLLDELQAQGWCPKISRELCRSQNYAVVYYMSRMTTPQRSSHKECSATACVGNNVDMKNYETRHTTEACQCNHVTVPIEQVRSIISEGGVPDRKSVV